MDCVAIGDSIAVGVSRPLGCETRAYVGWPSNKIINLASGRYHATCIISAGSNDPKNPHLRINLRKIRDRAKCSSYVWIRPMHSIAAAATMSVAREYGDIVVSFIPSKDRVHPRSYSELAKKVLTITK